MVAAINVNSAREFASPRLDFDLLRRLAQAEVVDKVAVATGPGSFTGLRVGVSFGLGLAIGLRVPIVPLATLQLQSARSPTPVTAVVEAGRGRYYFKAPGGETHLGEPADVPAGYPLVGNIADRRSLVAAGHHFKPEDELQPFWRAATKLLETAREVPYRNLEIEYMQTFLIPTKSEPSA
jgi:tRNA A37 threonylcarbamoyladenosine modification protein TsaB